MSLMLFVKKKVNILEFWQTSEYAYKHPPPPPSLEFEKEEKNILPV